MLSSRALGVDVKVLVGNSGRQILLAIVLAVVALIFIIIVGFAIIALGFSPGTIYAFSSSSLSS